MLSLLGRVMLEEQEFSSSEVLKIFVESGTGSAKMCRELIYIRITKGTLKRQSEILQNHYAQKTSWGHGDLNAGHRTPSPVGYQATLWPRTADLRMQR